MKLINEKYVSALWEIEMFAKSNGFQNLQAHVVSLPNDLDFIVKEMKKSVLESRKFSLQSKPNSEEPLDLSVHK